MVRNLFVLKREEIEETRENLIPRNFPILICHGILNVWANQG
jgi:hypothetical protein